MKESDTEYNETEPDPDSDFSSVIENEPDKDKTATKRDPHTPDIDHRKSYKRSWRAASPLTKLMIYFTAVIAGATLVFAFFSSWQWYEIHSGAEETRIIAQAAKLQAETSQDEFHRSHRPWIGLVGTPSVTEPLTFDDEATISVDYAIRNTGTSAAKGVFQVTGLVVGPHPLSGSQDVIERQCHPDFVKSFSDKVGLPLILPGDTFRSDTPRRVTLKQQEFRTGPPGELPYVWLWVVLST